MNNLFNEQLIQKFIETKIDFEPLTSDEKTGRTGTLATLAIFAAIGGLVAIGIATVTGITVAPAVVGGAIVLRAALAVCSDVNRFIDWVW